MVSVYPFVASLESSMRLYSRCLGSLARIGLESSVKKSEFEAKVSVTVVVAPGACITWALRGEEGNGSAAAAGLLDGYSHLVER